MSTSSRGAPLPPSAAQAPVSPSAAPDSLLVLLTLAIGFVMAMIDVTAVNVALPDIAVSLTVPLTGLVWVVDGYTLTFAALLLAGGALADRLGPKAVYQGGLALFIVGSILCGAAPGGTALIAARLLQGAGAALFMPSSLSLLTHTYTDDRVRAKMLGLWSAMVGAASSAGPLVGGILVHQFGWRSVFWINVPIGLAGIALAQRLIAAPPRHARDLSLLSHLLGVAALTALSFVLIEGPSLGWTSPAVLAAVAVFVLAALALVRQERGGAHPLLPRALFATPSFAAANGIGFLINFAVFGQLFLLSLYLQQARGGGALQAGLQLLPLMAAFTAGNLTSGRIMARHGARLPMLGGLSVGLVMALLLTALRQTTPYPLLVLGVVLMNVAVGIAIPAMTTTVMQVAGRAHANSAAAALNANRQIGALVGVALMGTILHTLADWNVRLPVAFGLVALAYAAAAALAHRFIRLPKPQGVVAVAGE
jgi:DHA2 family methylenomycin A resistance protein-like MFS transporter